MKTKKILLLLSLITIGIYTVSAQQAMLGIRAGVNIATISGAGNIYDNSNLRIGSSDAAMVGYSFNKTWSLFGELGFEQKGLRNQEATNGINTETMRRFDYLSVPIALRGIYPMNAKVSLYGEIGPYNSFLIKSSCDETQNGEGTVTRSTDPNIKNSDFGWWVGGGMEFPVAGKKLNLDMRYSRSIMEVDNTNSDLRNKALSLSLGFWF